MGGTHGASHLTGRTRGRPRRNPVVDHHGGTSQENERRTVATVAATPPLEFNPFSSLHLREFTLCEMSGPQYVTIEDAHSALADSPHGQLRLEGHTEFAHQNYVERPGESESNLGRNRHPASRKSEDHDIFILEMAPLELLGQTPTSINPVTKHLDHLLYCHQLVFKSSR